MRQQILLIAGPTGSGKSSRAVEEALRRARLPEGRQGEVISVDSRQVYRGLDIGTEKITREEMRGVPHHLIDIRDANDAYSAGDFATDAARLIEDISARGKLPILAGGSHFYFDALLKGLPMIPIDHALRQELEALSSAELYARIKRLDPARLTNLDPKNRRRLIRALEIIAAKGRVPERQAPSAKYDIETIIINPPPEELRTRLAERLSNAFARGLIKEVARVRGEVGDERLTELGLEYRVVGEYLRGEREEASLLPTLISKLAQFARRQRAWLRKLENELNWVTA